MVKSRIHLQWERRKDKKVKAVEGAQNYKKWEKRI